MMKAHFLKLICEVLLAVGVASIVFLWVMRIAARIQELLAPVLAWLARFVMAVFWAAIIAPITGLSFGLAAGALDQDGAVVGVTTGAVTFLGAVMILMRRSSRPAFVRRTIFRRPICARVNSSQPSAGTYNSSARWSSPAKPPHDHAPSASPPDPPPEPLATDPLARAWGHAVRMTGRYRERLDLARTRCAALLASADAAPDDLVLYDWANVIRRRVPELVAACRSAQAGVSAQAADGLVGDLVAALDAIGREAETRRLAAQAEAQARFDTMRAYVAGRTGGAMNRDDRS